MKRITLFLLSLIAFCASAQSSFEDIFVDQQWLQDRYQQENIRILHIDNAEQYIYGHIPGSVYLDSEAFAIRKGQLSWELPEVSYLDSTFRKHGISDKTTNVIVYGGDFFASAFRLYFTMDYLGLSDRTYLLNGGLPGWKSKDFPVSKENNDPEEVPKGMLTLEPNTKLLASKDDVKSRIGQSKFVLLDARRPGYFSGESKGSYIRSGHIPSAANITWTELVDEQMFLLPQNELQAFWDEAGISSETQVTTYCHVGLRATVLYTISKAMGYPVQLYDGSYNEWDTLDPEIYPSESTDD